MVEKHHHRKGPRVLAGLTIILLNLGVVSARGQELRLSMPPGEASVAEGDTLVWPLSVAGPADSLPAPAVRFEIDESTLVQDVSARIDSTGRLWFVAGHGVAGRQEPAVRVPVNVQATDGAGRRATGQVVVMVRHVNRAPVVSEVPPGYARLDEPFTFNLRNVVYDEDGDALTFSPVLADLPESATLSREGQFTWTFSTSMYRRLPRQVGFSVSDGQATVRGKLEVRQSQAGLPPRVIVLGNPGTLVLDEGKRVSILLEITDPNGPDNLANVFPGSGTLAYDDYRFIWPLNGDPTRAEFIFQPGHAFVEGGAKSRSVDVTFKATDQDRKESEGVTVKLTVNDTPDPDLLYREYRSALENATVLLTRLDEEQLALDRRIVRVRRSERSRRIVNTLLGMATTAFGIFTTGETQKIGAGVGGMLTTGLSGLEAARVFSSPDALERQLQDVKTEILRIRFEAESVARDYNTPEARVGSAFQQDRRSLDKLVLDSRTKLKITDAPPAATDEEIKRFTVYFAPQ